MGLIASRSLFFGIMGSAAVISLLRGFAVAAILPITDFGMYATLIGVGAFFSSFAGLGKVEEARKLFPRLAVDGEGSQIPASSDIIIRVMSKRVTLATFCAISIALTFKSTDWALSAMLVGIFVFGTAWCALLASALRAAKSPLPLGYNAMFRATLSLMAVVAGASYFSLQGALVGEAVASVFGALAMRITLRCLKWSVVEQQQNTHDKFNFPTSAVSKSGLYVFFGSLASTAPFYLGRPFAASIFSSAELATFSFLMLFVTAAVAGLGIADQIFGSDFVKMQRSGISYFSQTRRLILVVTITSTGIFSVFFFGYFAQPFPFMVEFFSKFSITERFFLPITVYAMLHVTTTIDWYFLAHDREDKLVKFSLVYAAVFAGSLAITALFELSLINFIWILALSKSVHLILSLHSAVFDIKSADT